MWSTPLFLLLITFSLISLLIGIPRQVRAIVQIRDFPTGAVQTATVFGIIQNLVFAVAAAGLGVLYGRQAGLHAPVFEALSGGRSPWEGIQTQLIPALIVGGISGFIFVVLYFRGFRPRIEEETAVIVERLRLEMGLPARILIGGVHEEIVFRWGVMGFLAWVGSKLIGNTTPFVIGSAIILAGLVFGLAHLPGAATLGIKPTRALITASLVLNLLAGIVFGWLFWQYGLLSAMVAHALYHILLFPVERRFINK